MALVMNQSCANLSQAVSNWQQWPAQPLAHILVSQILLLTANINAQIIPQQHPYNNNKLIDIDGINKQGIQSYTDIIQFCIYYRIENNKQFGVTNKQQLQNIMSRSVPWRNKPTALISQMIPVASQMKLFLVNQIGPTSFMFKDQNDNKFKVVIGSKISCSCGIVQNDHCIHTLYVMLKKYKVPESHPILWQASYLDSQLEGLIQLKYMQKKKQNTTKFKPRKKINNATEGQNNDDFPPLDQDQNCPICYEDMVGQCYSSCETCKKCMHTKCLKVWVRHKQDHGQSVTCPMCRSQFHNPTGMIATDMQRWQKRFTIHKGTVCKTCGIKNIKGLIYKCLHCPHTDLCKFCYQGNQHLEHDRYFVKELSNQSWKIAPPRVKKSRQQLFELIKQFQTKDLPSDINSTQFVLSLFPTIKQHNISQSANQLGIVGNQMLMKQICYKCRTIGDESMKRLTCGHSVHALCLKDMIEKKDYLCQVDQQPICPGYLAAMGIKVKPNKKAVMADVAFMRAEEETNKIRQKLGSQNMNFGVGVKVSRLNQKTRQSSVNKNNAKSKDRNFRIMKKAIIQKRSELDQLGIGVGFGSPMMITGLTQGHNFSNNMMSNQIYGLNIPKPPSQGVSRNRTMPKP